MLSEAGSTIWLNNKRRWLWVPAFAGTTPSMMRLRRDQLVLDRCNGLIGHQLVAEHAGFFPRRFRRKAPQQDQQRLGGPGIGFAMRQHAFDHAAAQSGGGSEGVDISGFMADFE